VLVWLLWWRPSPGFAPDDQIASREGYLEMVQMLLASVSIGIAQDGPLKNQEALEWCDVNAKNRSSQSALMLAVGPAVCDLMRRA
jgi:predicted AAA+ superfamily ATPase